MSPRPLSEVEQSVAFAATMRSEYVPASTELREDTEAKFRPPCCTNLPANADVPSGLRHTSIAGASGMKWPMRTLRRTRGPGVAGGAQGECEDDRDGGEAQHASEAPGE